MTLREAIELYGRETTPQRSAMVSRYITWTKGDNSDALFTKYLRQMEQDGYKKGTVDLHRRTVRAFYRRFNLTPPKAKGFHYDLVKDSSRPALAPETVHAMIDAAKEGHLTDREVALLALSTTYGMRAEEMMSVRAADVDLEGHRIFIRTAKHGKQRWCWVPPEIAPYLDVEWSGGGDVYAIFANLWALVSDAPKPKGVGFHSIRRSLVRGLEQAGAPRSDVIRFMRWQNAGSGAERNAYIYGNPSEQVSAEGVEAIREGEEGTREYDRAVWGKHPFASRWG